MRCKVCNVEFDDFSGGYENGTCCLACFDRLTLEEIRQEDSAINKMESAIADYEMADLLSNEINSCLEKMKKKELLKTIEQLEKETGQTISEVSDDE